MQLSERRLRIAPTDTESALILCRAGVALGDLERQRLGLHRAEAWPDLPAIPYWRTPRRRRKVVA